MKDFMASYYHAQKSSCETAVVTTQREYILNHIVHHRAQLGVYLRLNDIPVPGAYGPSADES